MDHRSADRPLDEGVVAEIVADQLPFLAGAHVERLGAGWDNELFIVADEWVLRFPKRAERVAWQARERQIVALAREALGALVPVFDHVGDPSRLFPYPFVAYRALPGVAADHLTEPSAAFAADLGEALGRLHVIDPCRVPATPTGREEEALGVHLTDLVTYASAVRAHLTDDRLAEAEPYLTGRIDVPHAACSRRFTHNDICAEHVLVDPADGRLSGIVDWTDAMATDPVVDFVGLITIGDWAFIDQVIAAYPLALDEDFGARVTWLARALTLRWLGEALTEESAALSTHLEWVDRAFKGSPAMT
ncbi:MAG: phosphotransferase family protein [Acidimicrobiales bacterium]